MKYFELAHKINELLPSWPFIVVSFIGSADGYYAFVLLVPTLYALFWILGTDLSYKYDFLDRKTGHVLQWPRALSRTNVFCSIFIYLIASSVYGALLLDICHLKSDDLASLLVGFVWVLPLRVISRSWVFFLIMWVVLVGFITIFGIREGKAPIWKYVSVRAFALLILSVGSTIMTGVAFVLLGKGTATVLISC